MYVIYFLKLYTSTLKQPMFLSVIYVDEGAYSWIWDSM